MDKILKGANLQGLTIDVGHVLFAQNIISTPASPALDWVRDYALVEMWTGVHPREPINRLPISFIELENRLTKCYRKNELRNDPLGSFWEQSDEVNAILSAQIVVPEDEIKTFQNLKKKEKNKDEAQMIVGKFGAATGLTFGTVNKVKSVTRLPTVIGRVMVTWEICVVGPVHEPGINKGIPTCFSIAGDSGSAVWDLKGRVLGLLASRLEQEGVPDTSYITSLDRIIRDLEAEGAKVTLL